jgi:hypothetical protein
VTLLDAFNVLLKVGSLSGLAAFIWQLLKALDEHRGRLKIVAQLGTGATLDVLVAYRPKTEHQALHAYAKVLQPRGVWLRAIEQPSRAEDLTRTIHRLAKTLEHGRSADVRLLHGAGDAPGVYSGRVVLGPVIARDGSAVICIAICARGRVAPLAIRHARVSAVD